MAPGLAREPLRTKLFPLGLKAVNAGMTGFSLANLRSVFTLNFTPLQGLQAPGGLRMLPR